MNNARRKQIAKLAAEWEETAMEIERIGSELAALKDEEQEAYDNLPESLQNGERGEQMQSAIDALEEAVSSMETVCEEVGEKFSTLAEC